MNAHEKNHVSISPRSIHPRSLPCIAAAIGVSMFLTMNGCQWIHSMSGQTESDDKALGATSRPATTQLSSHSVSPVPAGLETTNRPVVQGPLPLIYLVEADGMLRVRNTESGEEIVTFAVKAMQIVRVETMGVMLANKPVIGANLSQGNYAIEVVNPDSNAVRSTQKRSVLQSQ